MNAIARFAVKYPTTVLMLVLGIILLGFISFGKLGTDLFPDLNNPKIYIELKAGMAAPVFRRPGASHRRRLPAGSYRRRG